MFTHIVFFWLTDEAPANAAASIVADCDSLLSRIPGVLKVTAGKPAMTPREVVDNTYGVGLCVLLEGRSAHDAYQAHELHQQFIARNKKHWKRIQVYDFE